MRFLLLYDHICAIEFFFIDEKPIRLLNKQEDRKKRHKSRSNKIYFLLTRNWTIGDVVTATFAFG